MVKRMFGENAKNITPKKRKKWRKLHYKEFLLSSLNTVMVTQ